MSYKNTGFRYLFVKFLDMSYVLKAFYFRCNIHFYLKGICQVTTHSYIHSILLSFLPLAIHS